MRTFLFVYISWLFAFPLSSQAQGISSLVPMNTATHKAVQNGSWFNAATWDTGTIPGDGAIVFIPQGMEVDYEGSSNAHLFAIRVDGEFTCTQANSNQITRLTFDTFIGTTSSKVKFLANGTTDGTIEVTISPFDIEAYKTENNNWNAAASAHFSDGAITYQVTKSVGPEDRFNSYQEALQGNTGVTETSRTVYNDGSGVTGRCHWDPTQLSLGLVTLGELEITGKEKLNMVELAADAPKNQANFQLEELPLGWKTGDQVLVTRGGNMLTNSNGEDLGIISSISGNFISLNQNLTKNHEGRPQDNLHCYVGNLTRNITFSSGSTANIHHRGHLMAMHNDTHVQIRNASFIDMGRTNKSRLLDDFIWNNWLDPVVFKSKISALGQGRSRSDP